MMLEDNPGGVILSTDDYFYKCGKYHYDAHCLGEAHEWNRKRGEKYIIDWLACLHFSACVLFKKLPVL